MLPEEGKPSLHGLGVSILNLDKAAEGDSFKVFLALFMHKVTAGDGPAFDDARERHWPGHGEVEVICGADGKISEELHIADAVGSQLKVANWEAIFCLPPQGS